MENNSLSAISDLELAELYAGLDPETVISPVERRNLAQVADSVEIELEKRRLAEPVVQPKRRIRTN